MLSQDQINELFDYNDGALVWKINKGDQNYGAKKGDTAAQNCSFRPMVRIGLKTYRTHLLIWVMFNGTIPKGFEIDHRDRDKKNCRIENLRLCTRQQNLFNRAKFNKNKSGFKGVIKEGKRFRSQMTFNGKTIRLGSFETPEAAAEKYAEKAKQLHGEFACV